MQGAAAAAQTLRWNTTSEPVTWAEPGIALTVALTLPPPWRAAVQATTAALHAGFDAAPNNAFLPHISLCQSFQPAAREGTPAALRAIVRALVGLPPATIRIGNVDSFADDEGAPAVVYLDAQANWLHLANLRLVRETAPHREPPTPDAPPAGNPAFDLGGYTPHITLLFTRYLPEAAERRRALARAAALWRQQRPADAGTGFTPVEAIVTVRSLVGDPALARPQILRRWRLPASPDAWRCCE